MEIDLAKPFEGQMEFYAARGKAIDAYAGLEASLCRLLGVLMRIDDKAAAIIFYKITNTSSRNQIIENLLADRHKDAYSIFWFGVPKTHHKRGMIHLIRDLDTERNKIVHWHSGLFIEDERPIIRLVKPASWGAETDQAESLETGDFLAFSMKADWVSRCLNMFTFFISGARLSLPAEQQHTWRDIFQQPCTYPPSNNHPINQTSEERPIPPQSFHL